MKGTSNLIMWLTLVLAVSLAMVLGLILLLLAELYCSPFICRRFRRRQFTTNAATVTVAATRNDVESQLPSSPKNQETGRINSQDNVVIQKGRLSHSVNRSSLVYISNPIYVNENGRGSRVENDGGTPFETPGSSPSRLGSEDNGGGGDEKKEISAKVVINPQLTAMKKLPADASAVCLKDVQSLGTSSSDTNSNVGVSTSCSLTPCTSPFHMNDI